MCAKLGASDRVGAVAASMRRRLIGQDVQSKQFSDVDRVSAAESERLVAWIRVAALPVLALGETIPHPDPNVSQFYVVLTLFSVFSVGVLAATHTREVGRRFAVATTMVDIAAITALVVLSGGAFSPARLAFFLIPVTVAFRFRPALTGVSVVVVLAAYLVQSLFHPSANASGSGRDIAVRAAYLGLVGAAAVLLSYALERRTRNLVEVATEREQLQERYRALFTGVPIGLFQMGADGTLLEQNPAMLELLGPLDGEATGGLGASGFHVGADDRLRWRELADAGRLRGVELEARRGDGEARWLRTSGRAVKDDEGRTLYYEGSLEDVTERRRVEEELARRARQQQRVAELGRLALETRELSTVRDTAVTRAADELGVEYAKVLELLPGGESFLLQAGVGWDEGLVGHAHVGASTGSQAGYTLLEGTPVVVQDLESETRFSGPALLTDHGVRGGVSVVIGPAEAPYGILGAHSRRVRSFSEDDVTFLQSVANIIAASVERAKAEALVRESQEQLALARRRLMADALAAEERERQALADSLHDGAVQNLLSARHELEEAAEVVEHPALGRADAALTNTISDLREAIFELHPFVLDEAGLDVAVRTVSERTARRGRFNLRCEVDRLTSHPNGRLLLSAARQLLANAAEHSGARNVTVRLTTRGPRIVLEVEDDGSGFDAAAVLPARLAQGHIGLASQRERVESAGGVFEIESAPGRGTRVVVTLPAEGEKSPEPTDGRATPVGDRAVPPRLRPAGMTGESS